MDVLNPRRGRCGYTLPCWTRWWYGWCLLPSYRWWSDEARPGLPPFQSQHCWPGTQGSYWMISTARRSLTTYPGLPSSGMLTPHGNGGYFMVRLCAFNPSNAQKGQKQQRGWGEEYVLIYSQTSLIHASLICMPHNPNKLPGNLFLVFHRFLFTMIQ